MAGSKESSALDKETSRLEAFSDGVFAIAITLLILEIRVPQLQVESNGNLLLSLGRLWPSFLAFVLSFFVVLLIWINHHELFRMVNRVDRVLMFANGSLLLMVTFIPFPTAMLARYFGTPAANTAVAFYCGTFLVSSICHNLLLESVSAQPKAPSPRRQQRSRFRGSGEPIVWDWRCIRFPFWSRYSAPSVA